MTFPALMIYLNSSTIESTITVNNANPGTTTYGGEKTQDVQLRI